MWSLQLLIICASLHKNVLFMSHCDKNQNQSSVSVIFVEHVNYLLQVLSNYFNKGQSKVCYIGCKW